MPIHSPPKAGYEREAIARSVSRRVKLADRVADYAIRSCGAGIIVIVALIFVFIALETVPLFRPARQGVVFDQPLPSAPPAAQVMALGVDEYESHLYFLDVARGEVRFLETRDRAQSEVFAVPALASTSAASAYRLPAHDKVLIGTADGRVVIAEAKFTVSYSAENVRTVRPAFNQLAVLKVAGDGAALVRVHARQNSSGDIFYAAATADGRVFTGKWVEGEPVEPALPVGGAFKGAISALIIDYEGNKLFVATFSRKLHQYYLGENREAPFRTYDMPSSISAMDFSIGDVALLMGFENGAVESWFGVREKETDSLKPIHRIHSFEALPAVVTRIQPSARDKGFAAGAGDGTTRLYFSTSERTMLTFQISSAVRQLAYGPKLTSLLALGDDGRLRFTSVDNPHPEISFKALFGKVHYEGYDQPDYIWQSTGGTDDFEAKFSLVPLAIGTLKGAFYGLLFAIPLAVFAALYTSQLMAPGLRVWLKPTVEIMAALPSVVVGFLAGLWLAPRLEEIMVGTLLCAVVIPLVVVTGAAVWTTLPRAFRHRLPSGMELLAIIPLVVLGFWIAQSLGPVVEAAFFEGNYRQWVFDALGKQFEQRNSIVIGIAMGFAVIPIIFTISEDAFTNVPGSFKSASYALGASKWQTAWRVILPTASPGVFSAVMIGFGRAVGETMIVLMATGNTPILSFSPFNGMRTLSANIAVEIPEAPMGGTLYRVLFVAALLLFALTFCCNTVAEIIRQRLRGKYQAV